MPYKYGVWIWRNPSQINEEEEEGEMLNNFRIGCDPEFMLLRQDGIQIAAVDHFGLYGDIGYDHGGRVAEYRPSPSKGVMPIMKKIKELVKKTKDKVPNAKLRAGAVCKGDCLGGHVHFGFNGFEIKPPDGMGSLQGGKLNAKGVVTTKALDALTKTLEHLDILPKQESAFRRASGQGILMKYGAFGDVRDCKGHMEYRTMASWLFDPKVAFLCMTAAKLAACDPEGTIAALKDCDSFRKFSNWLDQYKDKDLNAKRASEKLLEKGLKHVQIDPSVDFGERWGGLGV